MCLILDNTSTDVPDTTDRASADAPESEENVSTDLQYLVLKTTLVRMYLILQTTLVQMYLILKTTTSTNLPDTNRIRCICTSVFTCTNVPDIEDTRANVPDTISIKYICTSVVLTADNTGTYVLDTEDNTSTNVPQNAPHTADTASTDVLILKRTIIIYVHICIRTCQTCRLGSKLLIIPKLCVTFQSPKEHGKRRTLL